MFQLLLAICRDATGENPAAFESEIEPGTGRSPGAAYRVRGGPPALFGRGLRARIDALIEKTDLLAETPLGPEQRRILAALRAALESLLAAIDENPDPPEDCRRRPSQQFSVK